MSCRAVVYTRWELQFRLLPGTTVGILLTNFFVAFLNVFSATDKAYTCEEKYRAKYAVNGYHLYIARAAACFYKLHSCCNKANNAQYC